MAAPDSWAQRVRDACVDSGTPGAVVGVWHADTSTVLAHGVLSTRTAVAVTEDSVFQIGSITKTWTATMIAQLVAEGRLDLGSTVAEVLPGIRLGSPDRSGSITVEHLLTHSSGLDGDVFTDTGRGDDAVEHYVDLLGDVAAVHEPGLAYSYCNTGFVLLGRMIELLDDRTWDASLNARLLAPLGLHDTCTLPEEALLRRVAVGHQDGLPVAQWGLPRALGPAGLITTTAGDLLTYARQWLDEDAPSHLRVMTEPRLDVPGGDDLVSIGLGWMVGRWGQHVVLGHNGGTLGQSAELRVVPTLGLAICVLTNASHVNALWDAIVPMVLQDLCDLQPPPRPAPDPACMPADLDRHVGVYERRALRFEVELDHEHLPGLSVGLVPIGDLAHLSTAERVRLHPCDDSGDRFVARSEGSDDPWSSFSFAVLPDGTPQLFFVGRVAPRVEARVEAR